MDKEQILEMLKNRDPSVMDYLFDTYYEKLYFFAEKIIYDSEAANDMIQNVFLRIWDGYSNLDIRTSVKSYLFVSVKNECLQHLRKLKVRDENNTKWASAYLESLNLDAVEEDNDALIAKIKYYMRELPEQCRTIFEYRAFYGYKYKEIALMMNISENVVKVQMYRAYKKLNNMNNRENDSL